MKRTLALLACLLLIALPVVAQGTVPDGTVGVFVYRIEDGQAVQVGEPIVVLPPAGAVCLPDGAA